MRRSTVLKFVLLIAAGFAAAFGAQAQPPAPESGLPVIDLGDRQQNEVYPLTLAARNLNCNSPQDFRFDLRNALFVIALTDPVVRQVPPGEERTVPAQMIFTLVPPGEQQAVVSTICETCGKGPFGNRCRADVQQIVLRVNVIPPPVNPPQPTPIPPAQPETPAIGPIPGPGEAPQPQPQSPPQPDANDIVGLGDAPPPPPPRPSDGGKCPAELADWEAFQPSFQIGLEGFLDSGQKNALDKARGKASAAAAAAQEANDELGRLKKKKRDCWEELAALRAAQAAKEAAADAAEADADAAQKAADNGPEKKAADKAQKAVDDFQKDVDAAQREYDRWTEAAQRQQDYLEIVIAEEGGLDSKRGQNAKKYYEDADKKRDAARQNLDKTKNSMAERQAKLAEAQAALAAKQAEADAKKAEAAEARAEANAAKEAADAKERECLGFDEEVKDAEAKAAAADAVSEEADKARKKAETAAAGQARRNLAEAAACKKDECERIKKRWDDYFRKLTNAKKSLEQIGYYQKQEAPPKQPNDLWNDYLKLGYTTFVKLAARTAQLALPGGVPTASNVQLLLPILQAAYGIAGIRQSALTPGTYAHGRTQGAELRGWLEKNKFANDAKEAAEVEKLMEDLMRNPNLMAEKLAQAIAQLERCKEELAELEAQLASGKK